MNNKSENLKEKLKQALSSTARVISEDFENFQKKSNHINSKDFNLFDLDNLNTKDDFIKARAESDSNALKKNFRMIQYLKKTHQLILLVNLFIQ